MKIKRRFGIGRKVSLGYFAIIMITSLSSFYSIIKLRETRKTDQAVAEVFRTIEVKMDDFESMVDETKTLVNNWIYFPNDQEKNRLREIQDITFPELTSVLQDLANRRSDEKVLDSLAVIINLFDENIDHQMDLMGYLAKDEDYDSDSILFFLAIPTFDEKIEPQLSQIISIVGSFNNKLKIRSEQLIAEKNASLDNVEVLTLTVTILSILLGSIASILVSRSISIPVKRLNEIIKKMGIGELPEIRELGSKDEVGDMVTSLNSLRNNLEKTSNFALNIGKGHLDTDYTILSEKDVLGKSLLAMRDNLENVINETKNVVKEAGGEGNLGSRVNVSSKDGAWEELSISINDLLKSVGTPILEVNKVLDAMALGNLTKRYEAEAKGDILNLKNNLNKALVNLNSFLSTISRNAKIVDESSVEMKQGSEEMATNTSEIASAISEMSLGSQTQVAKVDESSGLVEDILNSSNEMGKKAEEINVAAKEGVGSSESGSRMVTNVVESMQNISLYAEKTNESIDILKDRSEQITRILGVIGDIAAQTNLLALNAAIEAAQAGEAGRGFAVVAEEIRKLAEDSRQSAKEIENLVHGVQNDTQQAATVIKTMLTSVKTGESVSGEVSKAFEKITTSSHKTLNHSEEILSRAKEQLSKIDQVVTITEGIVVIAEQTATGTEEMASSASELSSGMGNYNQKAEELSRVASELKSGISKFQLRSESGSLSNLKISRSGISGV